MLRKLSMAAVVLLLVLAFGTAVMAQSDSHEQTVGVSVTNPWVEWDGGGFGPDELTIDVEPGMARQYLTSNTFTVASSTNFSIEVSAAWAVGGERIEVNPNNDAVRAGDNVNNVFDIQISARGDESNYTSEADLSEPAAGTKTATGQLRTLGESDDAVSYGVTVTLVLVDEPGDDNMLPGGYDTSGWDSGGLNNRRFNSLPAGEYEVEVTVTITEE